MLEIYVDRQIRWTFDTPFAPNKGELINIQNITYKVVSRSFVVDYAGEAQPRVSCVLGVEPTDIKPTLR
jgi:hypothetical protein